MWSAISSFPSTARQNLVGIIKPNKLNDSPKQSLATRGSSVAYSLEITKSTKTTLTEQKHHKFDERSKTNCTLTLR